MRRFWQVVSGDRQGRGRTGGGPGRVRPCRATEVGAGGTGCIKGVGGVDSLPLLGHHHTATDSSSQAVGEEGGVAKKHPFLSAHFLLLLILLLLLLRK